MLIVHIKIDYSEWIHSVKELLVVRSAQSGQPHAVRAIITHHTLWNTHSQSGLDKVLEVSQLGLSIVHSLTLLHLGLQLGRLEYHHLTGGRSLVHDL